MYPIGYTAIQLEQTEEFRDWLIRLKDQKARTRVLAHLIAAASGNFGDCEPVGSGVSEMRIHVGPGYRLYYTRIGKTLYLMLVGGSKATQKRDIKRAIEMAEELQS